jgi:UDP-glucose 4-epimerase
MKTVLVTGGAGYVGSHTVGRLLSAGRRVVVLDDLSTGHIEVVQLFGRLYDSEQFCFENVDLCDADAVYEVFDRQRPDGVIDFAAKSLVGESQVEPRLYFDTNVVGFRNLVAAAKGIPIVKSTTAATYGDPRPEDLPLAESFQDVVVAEGRFDRSQLMPASVNFETLLQWYADEISDGTRHLALTENDRKKLMIPTNVYGITKLIDEIILEKGWNETSTAYTALRYFNVAGASESALIGEDHTPESHLIPIAYQAALGQRDGVTIFGADYATDDGTAIRDYVSVLELAEAHVACLDRMVDGPGAYTYNLGTRTGFSVREIIDTAREVSGVEIPETAGPRRQGDPERLIADVTKVRTEIGWTSSSTLKETMSKAWRWHRLNPNGYRPIQEERYNPFWRRWITFAAARGARPWDGHIEVADEAQAASAYDASCYLCPGNTRTSGQVNPKYSGTFVFPNDFPSMMSETHDPTPEGGSYRTRPSTGICEVIVYNPNHSQRMATMSTEDIRGIVESWVEVYDRLGSQQGIEYVLIFENRGDIMGNSQLHPHGQAYAYGSIPDLMVSGQLESFADGDFVAEALASELDDGRRIVYEDDSFCAFVPFAAWLPYDVILAPRRRLSSLSDATLSEKDDLAVALKQILSGLDSLFGSPYQYSLASERSSVVSPRWLSGLQGE